MWTDFNNSFNVAFSDELEKELEQNLSPHLKSVAALYLARVECSTLQFYSTLFNANVTQNRLFTVGYMSIRDAKFSFPVSMQINL